MMMDFGFVVMVIMTGLTSSAQILRVKGMFQMFICAKSVDCEWFILYLLHV